MSEKERKDEWPYETPSITKSNTANVACRRKNSERMEESRNPGNNTLLFARTPWMLFLAAARRHGRRFNLQERRRRYIPGTWFRLPQGDPRIEFSLMLNFALVMPNASRWNLNLGVADRFMKEYTYIREK